VRPEIADGFVNDLPAALQQEGAERRRDRGEVLFAQVHHEPVSHDRQTGNVQAHELARAKLEPNGVR